MSTTFKSTLMLAFAGCVYGAFLFLTKVANGFGYMRVDLFPAQYIFAALVFAIIVLVKYRHVRLKLKQQLKLALIGAFGFMTNFCLYETVAVTSSSFAVTMLFQCIWMGIVFDCLVTRKLPTKVTVIAGIVTIAGLPFATGLFDSGSSVNVPGLLWGLGSGASYAGMLWTSSHFETKVPSAVRTFYFGATQAVLASVTAPQFFTGAIFDPGVWAFAIPLGLCTGVIPVLIIMKFSPKVPLGIATIMLGMELPSTIALETIFLHQEQSPGNVFGALLICAGIVVANSHGITELRKRRRLKKE